MAAHDLRGEVTPVDANPLDHAPAGAHHYRILLRAHGRSFETRCSRPAGAPAPTVAQALAEAARRAHGVEEDRAHPAASTEGVSLYAERSAEADALMAFLGVDAFRDLLFEFGRRPAADIESGDPQGAPARGDEMTNEEPEALAEAAHEARRGLPAWAAALAAGPTAALALGGWLYARGRQRGGGVALALGAAGAVAAAVAGPLLSRRRVQDAEEEELKTLAAERASIETGRA